MGKSSPNTSQSSSVVRSREDRGKAAIWYAKNGWRIFPAWPIRDGACACGNPECDRPGKHPIGHLVPQGFKDATTDVATIKHWWSQVPDANLATPDFLRIDADTEHDGIEHWRELYHSHGGLPDTPICLTPRGGSHTYFRPPEGWPHSNARGNLPPDIDVRGHGTGYTMLPPSNHLQGVYEWELSSRPDEVAVAALPVWLAAILAPEPERATSGPAPEVPDTIEQGGRNEWLTSLAGTMRRRGMSETELFAALSATNQERCRPPLPDSEVASIAKSVARYEPSEPAPSSEAANNKREQPKTADYVAALKGLGYRFRMNDLDDSIEVARRDEGTGERIQERLQDGLRAHIDNQMRDLGFRSSVRIENTYHAQAWLNRYHPILSYLRKLEWDGKDHIGALVAHMTPAEAYNGEGGTLWHKRFLVRWLVGAVAKAYKQAQNFMLVLDGPQGVGKSYLARWLCPLPRYFSEGAIQPDDKDSLIRLARTWIWEVGELQATTRKADREALKNFVSMKEVTVRKPYGRYDMVKPALASMIGTINENGAGFLNDPTGHRRFVVIRLDSIDWDYEHSVDIHQLWAQAVALYAQGEPWRLTREEKAKQFAINQGYESQSPLEEMFFSFYRVDLESEEWLPAMDIIQELELQGLKGNQYALLRDLGGLMTKLGVRKGRPRLETTKKGVTKERRVTAYQGVVEL